MKLLSIWKSLAFHTKASLIFTVFVFLTVPFTVLSVNAVRDSRSKAACVGDCYYPDPVVSWSKQPYYQIETCLNTTQRGGAFCSKRTQSGGTSIALNFATGYTTYYWVDTLLYSTYPNIQWYSYSSGQTNCGSAAAGSLCNRTISWAAPVQTAQATNAGDATRNPCGATGTVSTCLSAKTVSYPGNTVQFVDFLPNYTFDVYVFIQGHLFNIIPNQNSGAAATFTKANLTLPAYGATGIANNPTFRWSVVPGASKYAIWVAETNNFSTGAYWANTVVPATCTSDCSKVWGSGGWTSQNGAPAAPATLVSGKTYYWLVWSCLSTTSCPITSISQIYSFTVATTTQAAPVLIYPKDGQTGVDNNPNFQWGASPGASAYVVGLSDQSDILSLQHFYRGILGASTCTATCSLGWNNGLRWFAFGSIAPKPYVLDPGKTYYWFIWACNPTECPLSGIKTGSFTTVGTITEVAPVIISPKGGISVASGAPSFVWSPVSGTTSTTYKLLIKYNNNNFSTGNFWEKDLSPLICWNKPNCTTDLGGAWTYNNAGISNPSNPPNPLTGGRWYWIILNCKTTTCDLANLSASTTENFTVPVGLNSASGLNQSIGQCKSNGKVDVNFTWTPASGATEQVIYLSTQNNGFAPNTYLTLNAPVLLGLIANNWTWGDIVANTQHYWKISSRVNGAIYDSPTATFKTPICQVSSGLAGDLLRSGTKDDINAYINEVAGNEIDARSGNSLAYALQVTMAGESGGGNDCSYHIDNPTTKPHLTLGVFQYDAGTWQSGPNTTTSSNEALSNYDSGSTRATLPCWKVPGTETPPELNPVYDDFHNLFGGTNDGNIWDPYAQVRETAAYFRAGQQSRWSVYPW